MSEQGEPVKHFYFEYVGFGRWAKCDKATYDKTKDLYRLSLYTTPYVPEGRQQRKPLTVEEAALQLAEAIVRNMNDNAK